MSDDPAARLNYLDELADLLWPGARRGEGAASAQDLLIAPSAQRPRLLVPAAHRRAASRALGSHGAAPSRLQRWQRAALATAVRTGGERWLLRDRVAVPAGADTITTYLSKQLGEPVVAAMAITPPRANRKPVLDLMDGRGRSVGFAKIGINELTSRLVRHEAEVLGVLADAPTTLTSAMRVPRVRHFGQWHGLDVLVLSALPTVGARPAAGPRLTPAMTALAEQRALCEPLPSGYGTALAARAAAVDIASSDSDAAAALHACRSSVTDLVATGGPDRLTTGAWHGDWTPWNCGVAGDDVLVWDWERATGPVPRGFDQLHYEVQYRLIIDRVPHPVAARECLANAPRTLAAWGMDPADATMTAAVYLADLAVRYLADNQRAWGGPGGRVETWLLPALHEYVSGTA